MAIATIDFDPLDPTIVSVQFTGQGQKHRPRTGAGYLDVGWLSLTIFGIRHLRVELLQKCGRFLIQPHDSEPVAQVDAVGARRAVVTQLYTGCGAEVKAVFAVALIGEVLGKEGRFPVL